MILHIAASVNADINIILRPYKSANLPPNNKKLPELRLIDVDIHAVSPCDIPKSLATTANPTNNAAEGNV
jgi:hypothetical protein